MLIESVKLLTAVYLDVVYFPDNTKGAVNNARVCNILF